MFQPPDDHGRIVGDRTNTGAAVSFENLFKRLAVIRVQGHNETAGRFGKQQAVVTQALVAGHLGQVYMHTLIAAQGYQGQMYGQPPPIDPVG